MSQPQCMLPMFFKPVVILVFIPASCTLLCLCSVRCRSLGTVMPALSPLTTQALPTQHQL